MVLWVAIIVVRVVHGSAVEQWVSVLGVVAGVEAGVEAAHDL